MSQQLNEKPDARGSPLPIAPTRDSSGSSSASEAHLADPDIELGVNVSPSQTSTKEKELKGDGDEEAVAANQAPTAASKAADATFKVGKQRFTHVDAREHWWQLWRPRHLPPPAPTSFEDAQVMPFVRANAFSQLTYRWASPMMWLGYQRPLEATDLWRMDAEHEAEALSDRFLANWERRVREAQEYNERLERGDVPVGLARRNLWRAQSAWARAAGKKGDDAVRGGLEERERKWRMPPPPPPPSSASAAASSKPTKAGGADKAGGGGAGGARPPRRPKAPKTLSGHRKPSLTMALLEMFRWQIILAISIKIAGDVLQITAPLLIRRIIEFGGRTYAHAQDPRQPATNAGEGVGLSIGLFAMQVAASLCQHQFFFRTMSMGVHSRTALIAAIFKRSTRLGAKDRSAGKLLNHASSDVSRVDFAMQWWLLAFSSPIILALCLALLIVQIGASALAGFAILVLATPLQGIAIMAMFKARRGSMQWTDKRVKLVNELLSSIRVVKAFANESRFLERLHLYRTTELKGIRKLIFIRSANNAVAFSLPLIASVVAFIIYGINHPLNPARIFTALTLFQLLRLPLMFLPLSFSAATDGYQAMLRLESVFTAKQMEDQSERRPDAKHALTLENATFQYDVAAPPTADGASGSASKAGGGKTSARRQRLADGQAQAKKGANALLKKALHTSSSRAHSPSVPPRGSVSAPATQQQAQQAADAIASGKGDAEASPMQMAPQPIEIARGEGAQPGGATPAEEAEAEEPFKLLNLNLRVEHGELIGIVGPVGSGKSSLLEGLLGEVPLKSGRIVWGSGGGVAYVPQVPWIQAATVRDNILFGRPFDEERYWSVIKLCELEADLALLSSGDKTEIGEKGTNLSGGQKARVGLARAIYFDADTYIIDDPLSAVDAHVSRALFHNAILGLRAAGKTVLLVTHAIHVLPNCDRIVTMSVEGGIAEVGTYAELMQAGGAFCKLVDEFGGDEEKEDEENKEEEDVGIEEGGGGGKRPKKAGFAREDLTDEGERKALMEAEERNTGSIALDTWISYFSAARGKVTIPIVIASLVLANACTIMSSYWLVYWGEDKFGRPVGFYMGLYAMLGVLQAIFTFIMGISTGMLGYHAAKNLHAAAMKRILYAPLTTFFDVTPKGRIMNRVSKDIDTIDNTLIDSTRMAASTLANVIGAIILITILTHYFVIAVAVVLVFYVMGAIVYRRSATEVKRLDALLRSNLYAHFSESLGGLQVVRAYGELDRFLREHRRHLDVENRAYYFSIVNQRWLGVRLDLMGALLVFLVALLTSVGANSISPGQVGLALSYMLTVSQAFSWVVRQVSEVQNDMNSVERIRHYATQLDQEASQETSPAQHLSPQWPEHGALVLKDVELRYRPRLPLVLQGISLEVRAGEKIGIVGRTGAGKSSMLSALLRLVELEKGQVTLDGVDVATVGLKDLRTRVALLPQEPTLFSGTLRSNLDPFGQYDDARLNEALKHAYLIDSNDAPLHPKPVDAASSDVDHDAASAAEGGSTTMPAPSENGDSASQQHAHAPAAKRARFTLDTDISEEGSNLSLGERSLVSLARALVKQSKVIILDEATASVDVETDQRIQQTIRTYFHHATLLCVAHRLRTIINYDRVCVMDQGRVAEVDAPLALFDRGGTFAQMCAKANLTRDEIVRANEERLERLRADGAAAAAATTVTQA